MIKILFLAANPIDTTPLRLDEESRAIQQVLRQAEFRDRFEVEQQWAVRVSDLQELLLRHRPSIVHFSGHGSAQSEIILQDENGQSRVVSERALSQLFSILRDNIRCVVLNACFSDKQAGAIANHIDCVVGMSDAIGDKAAVRFAAAFYQALGYGKDVKTAFDLGCLQIDLDNLGEQDKPQLIAIRVDPTQVRFVDSVLSPAPSAPLPDLAVAPEPAEDVSDQTELRQFDRKGRGCFLQYGRLSAALVITLAIAIVAVGTIMERTGQLYTLFPAGATQTAAALAAPTPTQPPTQTPAPTATSTPELAATPTTPALSSAEIATELRAAKSLIDQQEWNEASQSYSTLIPSLQDPDDLVQAYFWRGFAFDQVGANEQAIADFTEVLTLGAAGELDSTEALSLVELARVERGLLYANVYQDCARAVPDLEAYLANDANRNEALVAAARTALSACAE